MGFVISSDMGSNWSLYPSYKLLERLKAAPKAATPARPRRAGKV